MLMTIQIKKEIAGRCKGCDRLLDLMSSDGELCSMCLGVVHELNKDLYMDDMIAMEDESA